MSSTMYGLVLNGCLAAVTVAFFVVAIMREKITPRYLTVLVITLVYSLIASLNHYLVTGVIVIGPAVTMLSETFRQMIMMLIPVVYVNFWDEALGRDYKFVKQLIAPLLMLALLVFNLFRPLLFSITEYSRLLPLYYYGLGNVLFALTQGWNIRNLMMSLTDAGKRKHIRWGGIAIALVLQVLAAGAEVRFDQLPLVSPALIISLLVILPAGLARQKSLEELSDEELLERIAGLRMAQPETEKPEEIRERITDLTSDLAEQIENINSQRQQPVFEEPSYIDEVLERTMELSISEEGPSAAELLIGIEPQSLPNEPVFKNLDRQIAEIEELNPLGNDDEELPDIDLNAETEAEVSGTVTSESEGEPETESVTEIPELEISEVSEPETEADQVLSEVTEPETAEIPEAETPAEIITEAEVSESGPEASAEGQPASEAEGSAVERSMMIPASENDLAEAYRDQIARDQAEYRERYEKEDLRNQKLLFTSLPDRHKAEAPKEQRPVSSIAETIKDIKIELAAVQLPEKVVIEQPEPLEEICRKPAEEVTTVSKPDAEDVPVAQPADEAAAEHEEELIELTETETPVLKQQEPEPVNEDETAVQPVKADKEPVELTADGCQQAEADTASTEEAVCDPVIEYDEELLEEPDSGPEPVIETTAEPESRAIEVKEIRQPAQTGNVRKYAPKHAVSVEKVENRQIKVVSHKLVHAGKRLLIVDPDRQETEMLRQILQDQGYELTAVSDALFMMESLQGPWALAYDGILLSDQSAMLGSYQAVRELKKNRDYEISGLPVVGIINDDDSSRVLALRCGMNDCCSRPLDGRQLTAALDRILK